MQPVGGTMNRLTPKAVAEIEEGFALKREALEILGVVVSEWDSDATAVQCFDLRMVERAKAIMKRLRELGTFT